MKKRVNLKIYGRVQGVWYRASTEKVARQLGVNGWVKNNFDGSVSVVAEGEEEVLKNFINWCWQGPPSAKVERIEEQWEDYKGEFSEFKVIYL